MAVVGGVLLFGVFPLQDGILFAFQFWLSFGPIFIGGYIYFVLKKLCFGAVPPSAAYLYPRDPERDIRRAYLGLMLQVTTVWVTTTLITIVSIWALKSGLGEEWNPFTRIRGLKPGPFWEYAVFDMLLFSCGFLALSGLLWLPMYVFFEGIDARRKIRAMQRADNA